MRTDKTTALVALSFTTALALLATPAHALQPPPLDPDGGIGGGPGTPPPPPPAVPDLRFGPLSVAEGTGGLTSASILLTLFTPYAGGVTFDIGTSLGSAGSLDLGAPTLLNQTIGLTSDAMTFQYQFDIVGDSLPEANETFSIVVSNVRAGGTAFVGTLEALVTILDDDAAGVPGVVSAPSALSLAGLGLAAVAASRWTARRRPRAARAAA